MQYVLGRQLRDEPQHKKNQAIYKKNILFQGRYPKLPGVTRHISCVLNDKPMSAARVQTLQTQSINQRPPQVMLSTTAITGTLSIKCTTKLRIVTLIMLQSTSEKMRVLRQFRSVSVNYFWDDRTQLLTREPRSITSDGNRDDDLFPVQFHAI